MQQIHLLLCREGDLRDAPHRNHWRGAASAVAERLESREETAGGREGSQCEHTMRRDSKVNPVCKLA